jgi:hypothetical protein
VPPAVMEGTIQNFAPTNFHRIHRILLTTGATVPTMGYPCQGIGHLNHEIIKPLQNNVWAPAIIHLRSYLRRRPANDVRAHGTSQQG